MSYPLLNVFFTTMWFFLWVLWIYMVCWVIFDVIRSPDLSGWVKAGWVALTIVLPFVGVLVYLIARGGTMHERQGRGAQGDAYRSRASSSVPSSDHAAELERLADLRQRSVITDAEFQQGKAKILAN